MNLDDNTNTDIVTSGKTDQYGNFLITGVKAGNIKISLSKPEDNYEDTFKIVTMVQGTNLSDIAIPMQISTTKISGQVVDGANSNPIEGVKVTIVGQSEISAMTDSTGTFRLDNVALNPSNKLLLFDATDKGYGLYTKTDVVVEQGTETILESPVRLYRSTRMVYGVVVDSRSGAGVGGLDVRLSYSDGTNEILETTTLSSGGFSFDSVVTSDTAIVKLEISDPETLSNGIPRYSSTTRELMVPSGQSPINVTPDIEVTPNFVNVRGFVLEKDTNQPVNTSTFTTDSSKIKVVIAEDPLKSSEVALSNGEFLIKNVPSGETISLRVYHETSGEPLFNNVVKNVTTGYISETNAGIIYIKLKKANLNGKIYDFYVDTAVVQDVKIVATVDELPGYSVTGYTDINGDYSLQVIPYDNYTLTISKDGYETLTKTYNTIGIDGNTEDFKIVPKTGVVTGTIYYDENGSGLLESSDPIIIYGNGNKYLNTRFEISYNYKEQTFKGYSNADGTFRLENVPVGSRFFEVAPEEGVATDLFCYKLGKSQ